MNIRFRPSYPLFVRQAAGQRANGAKNKTGRKETNETMFEKKLRKSLNPEKSLNAKIETLTSGQRPIDTEQRKKVAAVQFSVLVAVVGIRSTTGRNESISRESSSFVQWVGG